MDLLFLGLCRAVSSNPSPRKQQALELFEELPARYDELGAALSFFQDPRWRRAMISTVGATPEDRMLDVAAGTGLVTRALVKRYHCRVVALDQSAPMLSRAGAKLAADPALAERVELVEGEAEALPFGDAEFDHLTFTYLLRYVDDPAATLRELARVVKPGGRVVVVEFGQPEGLFGGLFRIYAKLVMPLIGQVLTGNRAAYEYLPRTSAAFPCGDQFLALMKSAGCFSETAATSLMFGTAWIYVGKVG